MDVVMMGEPYQGLVMLININASEYILRVLGTTRYTKITYSYSNGYIVISERGHYSSTDDLSSLVESRFSETVVCVGNPDLREGASVIKVRCSAIVRLEIITSNI